MAGRSEVRNLMVNFGALWTGVQMGVEMQKTGTLPISAPDEFGSSKSIELKTREDLLAMVQVIAKATSPIVEQHLVELGPEIKDPLFDEGVAIASNFPAGFPNLSMPQDSDAISDCLNSTLDGDAEFATAMQLLQAWMLRLITRFPGLQGPTAK